MKRIVWMAALILAVSGVAYGQIVEPPEGEATAAPAAELPPVVVGETAPAEPTAAEPATENPMIGAMPGGRRSSGRAMGMPEAAASPGAPRLRRRPGLGVMVGGPVAAAEVRMGGQFQLLDLQTGATYGPFTLRDETRIRVDGKQYVMKLIGGKAGGVKKTDEQIRLEEKLRRATVPDIAFEEAGLMEVVHYLSQQGDVNIVVTKPVQEEEVTITLRLSDVPLYDVIRYVTEVVGLWFRIDDHAVVITDHAVPIGGEIAPQPAGR